MRYIIYQETLIDFKEHVFTFLGSFVGIGLIGFLNSQHLKAHDNMFLIGSFGASSVLIYGITKALFTKERKKKPEKIYNHAERRWMSESVRVRCLLEGRFLRYLFHI